MQLASLIISKTVAYNLIKAGWLVDWSMASGASSQKIGYFADDKLQGLVEFERVPRSLYNFIYLIEVAPWNRGKEKQIKDVAGVLLAYVAKDSMESGFDGFVTFISKTILVDHYIDRYGARILHDNQLVFDTTASQKLIDRYLEADQ